MQDGSAFDEPSSADDLISVTSGGGGAPEPAHGGLPSGSHLPAAAASTSTVDEALSATSADRVLHSDPHDFAGLYIRHRSSFTLHARRYLRDGRDADEVVQEAFLRLFLALPELETELQALAYCRRTITNLCIDRYRAQARRPSLVDLDSVPAEDLADADPGDPVVRAEDAAIVREAMSLLSPLHRAALVKREIEEKPLPVIAEELDIPEENVKHLLFRARRALRRLLASTSLAPGSDSELAGGLTRAAKVSSGGMAGFLLVLALGLGTGPDLRAIPVVGADLPDLIPVTSPATDRAVGVASDVANGVAKAVNAAVTEVTGAVKSVTSDAEPTGGDAGTGGGSAERGPEPAGAPSPSPTASRTPGPVAPTFPPPAPVPPPGTSVVPGLPLTGGEVAVKVSPSPSSGSSAGNPADRTAADKAPADRTAADRTPSDKGSAGPSPSSGPSPSGRPVPSASPDAPQEGPQAPVPSDEPVASTEPVPEPVPDPAVDPVSPAAPAQTRAELKAEQKAAKRVTRQATSVLPPLTRRAPVLVLPAPAGVASPTSTVLPVAP